MRIIIETMINYQRTYILNEELMKSQQFIIDKGLEREYIDYVK